jgi:YidC/Oxa1 family membrane protein insertase
LQRDTQAPAGESSMVSTFTGPAVYTEQGKFQKINFKDIEKGNAKFKKKADNGWMAMVQHYFVSAWIPQEKLPREYYVRKLDGGVNPVVTAGVIVPVPTVAPGGEGEFCYVALCRSANPVDT